ncbi:alpha/beta fold hydrolase [Dactylosporangium siamense]|uniref:Alpha/beta hydrolase n=1 Tax=Dactylosporangium siamense TaxID=685454 RepID=A0A919PE82_9ACTN|nr:alpha/beta hydrolase [Dactylosporangium siamense]GIG42577.1 alpha/beta hydrolase [Dactylosporangium siamense]
MTSYGYCPTVHGQLHYAESGAGPAVLLLHQTPRSHDEYRDVLPILAGAGFRAIAMDTRGFGRSAAPPAAATIEDYADGVTALLDALGLDRVHLVGHHTGGVVAVEVAARWPDRVDRLVLSSTPYLDAEARAARAGRPPIDDGPLSPDGAHLAQLWQRRQAFYPAGRPDLLARFVRDALAASSLEDGHRAVSRYRMEERLPAVRARTLLIGADADPYAFVDLERMRAALPAAACVVLAGGGVPLPDQMPAEFAAAVLGFLPTPNAEELA